MLTVTDRGLYCQAGDFFIDPVRAVDRALITHAHSDHARRGCRSYLCAAEGGAVLRHRLGPQASVSVQPYGEMLLHRDVRVSFHPAGHVLGSAQIRLEHAGEVWVVSGDYKRQPDPTCTPFEPVACHTFITESTFALPIYRWPDPAGVFAEINAWWRENQRQERTSVLCAYSLGKAQRLLAGIDPAIGPVFVHAKVHELLPAFAAAGFPLPPTRLLVRDDLLAADRPPLLVAPPSSDDVIWLRESGRAETAFASGWMRVRGFRQPSGSGRGFVLSDHADWPALIDTVRETGAHRILVTHGTATPLVRWLNENGWDAAPLAARPDPASSPGTVAAGP